jgi:hypothetical protein
MKIVIAAISLLAFIYIPAFGAEVSSKAENVPASSAKVAPKLDGHLDEDCWKHTSFIPMEKKVAGGDKVDLAIINKSGGSASKSERTEAEFAVVYGKSGIYVGVQCFVGVTEELIADCEIEDGLFEFFRKNDVIEVFFDPGITKQDYYWFQANPKGMKTDLWANADPDRSWNGNWEVATYREKGVWTTEFFFPYAGFNRTPFQTKTGFSIVRFFPENNARAIWGGEYRSPDTWPVLEIPAQKSMVPTFRSTAFTINDLNLPNKGELSVSIESDIDEPTTVYPEFQIMRPHLGVGLQPEGNGPRLVAKLEPVSLETNSKISLASVIDIEDEESLVATLVLKDVKGKVLFCSPDTMLRLNHRIGGDGPEFNYYTTEAEARARFHIFNATSDFVLQAEILSDGRSLLQKDFPVGQADVEVAIPLSEVPFGRNELLMTLRNGDMAVASRRFPLVRHPANTKGSTVRTSRWSKSIEFNGKPFVPVGSSPLIAESGLDVGKSLMKDMRANHFNTLHIWGGYFVKSKKDAEPKTYAFDAKHVQAMFNAAAENDQKVILSIGEIVGNNLVSPFIKFKQLSDEDRMNHVSELVMAVRERKELLGYELIDEPEFFVDPAWLEKVYNRMKELDPYHLVTINNCRGSRNLLPYQRATDISSIDYYPIGKWAPKTIAQLTDDMVYLAGSKPVKWWIQGCKIFNPRAPTPHELIAMTYMAIAHGGSSIFYFIGKPSEQELWDAQGKCAEEIGLLTEAIAADSRQKAKVIPEVSSVYASHRRNGDNHWIIAVNEGDSLQKVKIQLPVELKDQSITIQRVFEPSVEVKVSEGTIDDEFTPFARQVYTIQPVTKPLSQTRMSE